MAKKSQIKHVLIKTETQGTKNAVSELNSIDKAIESVNKESAILKNNSRSMTKAFSGMAGVARDIDKAAASVTTSGKALNRAFSGNAAQTKAIDSYSTNIEFLISVLRELEVVAKSTGGAMSTVNSSMSKGPYANLASSIDVLVGQMQELVEGIDELNTGSRISNKRLKEVREYISDVGQASDLTTEQLEEMIVGLRGVGAQSEKTQGQVAKYNNGVRRMNEQGRSAKKGFSDIVFGSNPLVNAYAAIAVNVYAVSEAFRFLEEAAAFERLQDQLANFSAGVSGVNVRTLAKDLEEASGYALTFKESIDLSTQGTAFNFTTEQLTRLTSLTRKASIALGRNFADSMERVTKGIAKQEIEVLDEIGVVTRLETAFGKYATAVGKSTDELSEYERQLALTAEVERQLTEKYSGIDAKATEWEKLSAAIRSATLEGTGAVAEFLGPVAGYLERVVNGFNALERAKSSDNRDLTDQSKTFDIASNAKNLNVGAATNSFSELEAKLASVTEEYRNIVAENKALNKSFQEDFNIMTRFATRINQDIGQMSPTFDALIPDNMAKKIDYTYERAKDLKATQEDINKQLKEQYDTLIKIEPSLAMYEDLGSVAGEMLQLNKTLEGAEAIFSNINTESTKTGSTVEKATAQLSKMERSLVNLTNLNNPTKELEASFSRIKEILGSADFSSPTELKRALMEYDTLTKSLSSDTEIAKLGMREQDDGVLKSLVRDRQDILSLQEKAAGLGTIVSDKTREEWENAIRVLDARIAYEEVSIQTQATLEKNSQEYSFQQSLLQAQGKDTSDITANRIKQLKAEKAIRREAGLATRDIDNQIIALMSQKEISELLERQSDAAAQISHEYALQQAQLQQSGANQVELSKSKEAELEATIAKRAEDGLVTEELERQLEIQKQKTKFARENLALSQKLAGVSIANSLIDYNASNDSQDERTQVVYAQQRLDLQRARAESIQDELEKATALAQLSIKQKELDERTDAAPFRDAQTAFTDLQSLSGLTDLQSAGLDIGETLSTAFADAAEAGKTGMDGMISYLEGNAQAFSDVGVGIANAASSIFSSLSDSKIAGIDAEIAAEEARDGKSKESLKKLKKLEAEKIKEQAKASKAQVVMSTSVAIMRAFADFGIYGAIPAAILAGFGAMQVNQINSAANGQLAALNAGGSDGMSITGGDRNNEVDVSRGAQSGESAYYGGLSNDLPGRSGGGSVSAGDPVVLGEVGPEVFIPDVPGNVVPSGRSNNTGATPPNMSFNITATDADSFIGQIDRISAHIYDKVEEELRARHNTTLENLS